MGIGKTYNLLKKYRIFIFAFWKKGWYILYRTKALHFPQSLYIIKAPFGAFLIYSDKKGRHMRIRYLQKEGYGLSRWSGGVTSEIYIYPENGNYSQRDFKMRVSSAEVELEESVFTPLEGIDRWITPLEGSFELSHDGGPFLKMGPLDPPHFFSGGRAGAPGTSPGCSAGLLPAGSSAGSPAFSPASPPKAPVLPAVWFRFPPG